MLEDKQENKSKVLRANGLDCDHRLCVLAAPRSPSFQLIPAGQDAFYNSRPSQLPHIL